MVLSNSSASAGARTPVSVSRELVAAGIILVVWVGIAVVLTGARTTGPTVQNYGMFVDTAILVILAVFIGTFGATGRRWIAVVPAVLSPIQLIGAVIANEEGEDILYGWLLPSSIDSTAAMLPYLMASALFFTMTMAAWAYGFGRRPSGLIVAGVGAMALFAIRGAVMIEYINEIMGADLLEFVVLHLSVPAIFAVSVAAAHLAGSSVITVVPGGRIQDLDSGPRGGTIAATLGLVALLFMLIEVAPAPTAEWFHQAMLTFVAIAMVVAAGPRRLPVAAVGVALWLSYFVMRMVPALSDGFANGARWEFITELLGVQPAFVVNFAWPVLSVGPQLVCLALAWALLRCRRQVDVAVATGVVIVAHTALWAIYALIVTVVDALDSGSGYRIYQIVTRVVIALSIILIPTIVHIFVKRSDAALRSQGALGAPFAEPFAEPAAAVGVRVPQGSGPQQWETGRERPASKYPRAVGLTLPDA